LYPEGVKSFYLFTLTWQILSHSLPFIIFLFLLHGVTNFNQHLTVVLPESVMETFKVVLSFESVDEIIWCDHANETSSAVLLRGIICFLVF